MCFADVLVVEKLHACRSAKQESFFFLSDRERWLEINHPLLSPSFSRVCPTAHCCMRYMLVNLGEIESKRRSEEETSSPHSDGPLVPSSLMLAANAS